MATGAITIPMAVFTIRMTAMCRPWEFGLEIMRRAVGGAAGRT